MAVSDQETAPPKKAGRGRWFKVRVVLAVLVLVIGFTIYLNWRNSLPPTEVQRLSTGTAYIDVPLMTLFTFPSINAPGFYVRTNLSFAPSSSFTFAWTNLSGDGLPVQFVLSPTGPFQTGASGGFSFSPSGFAVGSDYAAVRPGLAGALVARWALNYTVRLMSQHDWFTDDRWLEVDYSLQEWGWSVGDLPIANTTAPSPSDLVPVSGPLQFSYGPGFAWTYGASVHDQALPQDTFSHPLPRISFEAGNLATLSAVLVSSFHWGAADDYRMTMGAADGANVTLRVFLDVRFGSLVPIVSG